MRTCERWRLAGFIFGYLVAFVPAISIAGDGGWSYAGGDQQNTRSASSTRISPENVGSLQQKWEFTTQGDVSATPTAQGDSVYFPDWGGYLYRVSAKTGNAVWSHKVSEYTGNAKSVSRTSPAIRGNTIVIGDQATGAVLAIDKNSGALVWQTVLDSLASITSSPVIVGNVVYVGVGAVNQEASYLSGITPTFRGSMAALDLKSGKVIWQLYTVPSGYTGGSVWGSNPVIDPKRGSVYFSTGNNYSVPPAIASCLMAAASVSDQVACIDPSDYYDSVIAADLQTGRLKWAARLEANSATGGADFWNVSCIFGAPGCPTPAGPDYDFGSAPNLFHVGSGDYWSGADDAESHDIVGCGQKSGMYWALNPDTGKVVWATQVGPGSTLGGIEWGSATDGEKVYVAITNLNHVPTTTIPAGATTSGGLWAALDATTGQIRWRVPATGSGLGLGSVSVANGVMFAGSTSGDMVALDGQTGNILFQFASGGAVIDGPSIVGDSVYWGSGYAHLGLFTGNNKVFAFTLP